VNDESVPVLWDAIRRTDGDIPWSALEAFAEALVARPDLIGDLFHAYDDAREAVQDRACYVHLYVPAILALAAPGLDERCRQEIGESLIARLVAAGEQDDHLIMEILVAACGAMGPVVLPLVFGVVIDETASSAAWDQLWGLTKLAVGSDPAVRGQVAAACVALLERVRREEVEYELGVEAARTLASLGLIEHVGLLGRLERQSRWTLAHGDYSDARRVLEEQRVSCFPQELWELPVREWLEPRWQRTRDWLVMRDSGWRNWEALQATYAAEPFAAPVPIVACAPQSGRKEPRYVAVRS
jgi:hypothetical protein